MKKPKINLLFRLLFTSVILGLIAALAFGYLTYVVKGMDYFTIRDIVSNQEGPIDLGYLKGRNIFTVDLEKESRRVTAMYPYCKNVRLVRILPNRLYVEFRSRLPVAVLKLYRFFLVDDEMVIFNPVSREQALDSKLPVIVGLETKIFGPKAGVRYESNELSFALDIIKAARAGRVLRYFRIRKLDAANINSVSFILDVPIRPALVPRDRKPAEPEGLEVKIGKGQVKGDLAVLEGLLVQLKNDWSNIKYIDLRFSEPVIKFKDKSNNL